jgi:ABC-type transporter Mla maintaining outer membrane lipid asymmetry ATPase subunit MlaF
MSVDVSAAAIQPIIELIDATTGQTWSSEAVGVSNVQWQVQRGDYWVVGGPPDSGKSGLLATAAGLLRPLRGSHRLFGKDLSRLSGEMFLHERLRVGCVSEAGTPLFHQQTVRDNIALPLRYHRNWSASEAESTVQRMIEYMELGTVAHLTPVRTNRIFLQRAGLARALVLAPEVLLLDNPLAGLNATQVRWWLDLLDQLAMGHEAMALPPMTLVITTEDFGPWRSRARQFALLKEKQWVWLGGQEALAGSEDPLVRELLAGDTTAIVS